MPEEVLRTDDGSVEETVRSTTSASASYAVGAVLAAMLMYAMTDVLVKTLAVRVHIAEILFFRNLFSFVLVAIVVRNDGGLAALRTGRLPLNILRAALGLASMVCYMIAFTRMPLADVIAIGSVAPLFLVTLSKVFLAEPVTADQWSAVLVGFGSALLILRPSYTIFQMWALVPLLGALFLALYMLLLRELAKTETRSSLMIYFPAVGVIASGSALPFVHSSLGCYDFSLLLLLGLLGGVALYLRNEGYSSAPASALAPCEYTGLLWACVFSVAIFGDPMTPQLMVGILMLIATNLYVVRRTRRLKIKTQQMGASK